MISWYELTLAVHANRGAGQHIPAQFSASNTLVLEVAAKGFEIERELIQELFEEGRITWEAAKEMRGNISLLEAKLQAD
jgi:hypothetical protein